MKRIIRPLVFWLFGVIGLIAVQPTTTRAANEPNVSCDFCPVVGVNPKASQALGPSDTSHSCSTGTKAGFPVPDPKCTPGAINPTVTLQVLKNKSFKTGCIRNCVTTEGDKNATYGLYSIPHPSDNEAQNQTCELDHLISLELGGADSLDNIWPQCGPNHVALQMRYFKQKDMVENYLAAQVKTGKIALDKAQQGIASDWTQYLGDAKSFCANSPKSCGGSGD
jgi:hypothetical protein